MTATVYVSFLISLFQFLPSVGPMSHLSLKRWGLREMGVSAENGIVGRHCSDYQSDRPWSSLDSEGQYFMFFGAKNLSYSKRDSSPQKENAVIIYPVSSCSKTI